MVSKTNGSKTNGTIDKKYSSILRGPIYPMFMQDLSTVKNEQKDYLKGLKEAKGDQIFIYLLLLNISTLKKYTSQTRLQAEQSFFLAKIVSIIGFVILVVGIGLGIYSVYTGKGNLNAAYLTSIAGILTEFISGVFFYLYNRTLQQLNLFHDKILVTQNIAMSFLANSLITDKKMRDEGKAELSKLLMSGMV
jgi:hypothetical protein